MKEKRTRILFYCSFLNKSSTLQEQIRIGEKPLFGCQRVGAAVCHLELEIERKTIGPKPSGIEGEGSRVLRMKNACRERRFALFLSLLSLFSLSFLSLLSLFSLSSLSLFSLFEFGLSWSAGFRS